MPTVRLFREADRPAVLRIAADTAFFGAPVEAYLEDRQIFLDAFYHYYIAHEPEHVWVAAEGDQVVGFLTGCFDTERQERIASQQVWPLAARNLLRFRYRVGARGLRYAWRLALGWLRREFPVVDLQIYPAHLHLNLDQSWRGQGLGSALLQAYLGQLTAAGIPGVHLHTTSLNEAACHLYEKHGFRLLAQRRTRLWEGYAPGEVFNRAYGLGIEHLKGE